MTDAESVIELTYRAQITPWMVLQPDAQDVLDPQDSRATNALVVGRRLKITF